MSAYDDDGGTGIFVGLCVIVLALVLVVGMQIGKGDVYEKGCESACELRGETMEFQENNMCVCSDTTLTSDFSLMWKERK